MIRECKVNKSLTWNGDISSRLAKQARQIRVARTRVYVLDGHDQVLPQLASLAYLKAQPCFNVIHGHPHSNKDLLIVNKTRCSQNLRLITPLVNDPNPRSRFPDHKRALKSLIEVSFNRQMGRPKPF